MDAGIAICGALVLVIMRCCAAHAVLEVTSTSIALLLDILCLLITLAVDI